MNIALMISVYNKNILLTYYLSLEKVLKIMKL